MPSFASALEAAGREEEEEEEAARAVREESGKMGEDLEARCQDLEARLAAAQAAATSDASDLAALRQRVDLAERAEAEAEHLRAEAQILDVSATLPRFFAQIRASRGGLRRLAAKLDGLESAVDESLGGGGAAAAAAAAREQEFRAQMGTAVERERAASAAALAPWHPRR